MALISKQNFSYRSLRWLSSPHPHLSSCRISFSFISSPSSVATAPSASCSFVAMEYNDFTKKSGRITDGVGIGSDIHIPVYSSTEVFQKLKERCQLGKKQSYRAMYSSIIGGITMDPTLMVIPLDDHMVHRGHGVFDTAMIFDGCMYELDAHIERLLTSASNAKISSPFSYSTLRSILIQLAAVSHCKQGSLRYWLSSGPGDFLLSPAGCPTPAFYAVVIEENLTRFKEGVKVVTSNIPMKSPQFATMKSVNYLPNVLSMMEAEEKGVYASIWIDNEGCIAEGPNVNVAMISKKNELLMPSFEKILSGCTAKRLLALAPNLVEQGLLKSVSTRDIPIEEAKDAAELMFVGSGLPVLPIVMWDGQPIGDGNPGRLTLRLSDMLWEDMLVGPETHRLRIPYPKVHLNGESPSLSNSD